VCEMTLTALNKGRGAFQDDDVALVCSALGSRQPLVIAVFTRGGASTLILLL